MIEYRRRERHARSEYVRSDCRTTPENSGGTTHRDLRPKHPAEGNGSLSAPHHLPSSVPSPLAGGELAGAVFGAIGDVDGAGSALAGAAGGAEGLLSDVGASVPDSPAEGAGLADDGVVGAADDEFDGEGAITGGALPDVDGGVSR